MQRIAPCITCLDPIRVIAMALTAVAFATDACFGQSIPTKEHIRSHVEAVFGAIETIEVRYSRPAAGDRGHEVVAELAFLGGHHMVVDGGHAWIGADWRQFYGRSRSYVVGDSFEVDWPNKLAWERIPIERGVRVERFEVQSWPRASGYWPDDASLPEPVAFGVPVGLRTALRTSEYQVRDRFQDWEGTPCVVLANACKDQIWLDPQRGFAMRGRRVTREDLPALEVSVKELSEVSPGFYLPDRYSLIVHCDGEGVPYETPVETHTKVLHTKVNCLRADDYRLRMRPGAIQFDRWNAQNYRQTEPGGIEFLFAEAGKERALCMTGTGSKSEAGAGWLAIGGLCGGSLLAAWLIPWFLASRRSRDIREASPMGERA